MVSTKTTTRKIRWEGAMYSCMLQFMRHVVGPQWGRAHTLPLSDFHYQTSFAFQEIHHLASTKYFLVAYSIISYNSLNLYFICYINFDQFSHIIWFNIIFFAYYIIFIYLYLLIFYWLVVIYKSPLIIFLSWKFEIWMKFEWCNLNIWNGTKFDIMSWGAAGVATFNTLIKCFQVTSENAWER